MDKRKISEVLSKEVNRKQFLQMSGFVALSILGIPAILDIVHRSHSVSAPSPSQLPKAGKGYGNRTYGR